MAETWEGLSPSASSSETWEGMAPKKAAAAPPKAAPTKEPWYSRAMGYAGETLSNIPQNIVDIGGSLVDLTWLAINPVARYEVAKQLDKPEVQAAIGEKIKGGWQRFKAHPLQSAGEFIKEHPVDAAMLFAGGTGLLGKGAEAAGAAKTAARLGKVAEYTDPLSLAAKGVGKVRQLTPTARAARIMRTGIQEGPAGAGAGAKVITRETGMPLSVAQRTESPTLTKLERQFAATPGEMQAEYAALRGQQAGAVSRKLEELRGPGDIGEPIEAARQARLDLETRATAARGASQAEYEALAADVPEEAGDALRQIAKDTRTEAKKIMDAKYAAVEGLAVTPEELAPLTDALDVWRDTARGAELLEKTPELAAFSRSKLARPLPGAKQVMGAVDVGVKEAEGATTIKDLDALRKWAGKRAYAMRTADPEQSMLLRDVVQKVNETEDAILATRGASPEVDALREARRYAREEFYPLFGKDAIGARLLATKGQPDVYKVLSSEFKKVFFPNQYGKVAKAKNDFTALFGGSPEATEYLKNLIRYDAWEAAKGDPVKIQRWLNTHREALRAYGMEGEFANVQSALRASESADAALIQFDNSPVSQFLKVDESQLGKKLLSNPRFMNSAADFTRNDPIARAGVKAAIGDELNASIGRLEWDTPVQISASANKLMTLRSRELPKLQRSGMYTPEELEAYNQLTEGTIRAAGKDVPPVKMKVDKGVRDTIARGVGYIGEALTGKWRGYAAGKGMAEWVQKLMLGRRNEILSRALLDPSEAHRLISFLNRLERAGSPAVAEGMITKYLRGAGAATLPVRVTQEQPYADEQAWRKAGE